MYKTVLSLAVSTAVLSTNVLAASRDYVSVVGSSTVYPFATVVAENFGKSSGMKTPKIESTGSGGGLKLFCAGVGVQHPDITNASRRIKQSEIDLCKTNGVSEIIEVKVGYDGIVLANAKSASQMELTIEEVFLALAREVPNPDGSETLVPNPYNMWSEINTDLPNSEIEVLGPPPTSGTRDAFAELGLEGGCKKFSFIKALKKSDKAKYKSVCHSVREDGRYIEAGENDNLIIQKLTSNPKALGIFGYSFLDQNYDKVQGSLIDGVEAEFENISEGAYPISRALYVYVKKAHIGAVPGIEGYIGEFASEKAWGEDGYLSDKGLIPMPEEERSRFENAVKEQTVLEKL